MAHTPTPWTIYDPVKHGDMGQIRIIFEDEGEQTTVCEIADDQRHEDENALIISAAPDLLAACEALLSTNSYWWQEANGTDDLIRAAVAKARGTA